MSGWSSPSTRPWSARAASNSGIARPRSSAARVGAGEIVAGCKGGGVVVAEHPAPIGKRGLEQRDGPAQVASLRGATRAVPVVGDGAGRMEPTGGGRAVSVVGAALHPDQAEPAVPGPAG